MKKKKKKKKKKIAKSAIICQLVGFSKHFFFISNKNSFIDRKRHPSTQGVYKGEQSRSKITKIK